MLRLPPSNSFLSLSHLLKLSHPPIPSFTPGHWKGCLETVLKIFSEVSHILINSALLSEVSRNKFSCLLSPTDEHSVLPLRLWTEPNEAGSELISLLSGNLCFKCTWLLIRPPSNSARKLLWLLHIDCNKFGDLEDAVPVIEMLRLQQINGH